MNKLQQIASRIIKEQELIMGPVAWYEAESVSGLHVINKDTGEVSIDDGQASSVIDRLVNKYENLFGPASHEVCKEAVVALIAELPLSEVPSSLK